MSAVLSSLKADLEKEERGDWMPSLNIPGVSFKVSSLHVPGFQRAQELLTMRLARKYKGEPVPAAVRAKELGRLYAEHILHDWQGLDEEYSKERALEVLSDPSYRQLTAEVLACAARMGEVDIEYTEGEEKN